MPITCSTGIFENIMALRFRLAATNKAHYKLVRDLLKTLNCSVFTRNRSQIDIKENTWKSRTKDTNTDRFIAANSTHCIQYKLVSANF